MSGIFGCWHLDGARLKDGALDAILAPVSVRPDFDEARTWRADPIVFGYHSRNRSSLSLSGRTPSIVSLFDGRLDNRDELSLALPERSFLGSSSSDADFV